MSIYFDNAATTRIDSEVLEVVKKYSDTLYANPSAMHRFGFNIEKDINDASSYVAKYINAEGSEIIWTSGASESNNLAIFGYINLHKRCGNHIITTKIEHSSVYKCFKELELEGYDVTYLDVDSKGHIDIDSLKKSIRDDTVLVSIMYVNNEIGSIQDIVNIGKVIKEKNKNTVFHVDAVQAFGKIKIDVKKSMIDMMSVSSHKFYGPKGCGFLYKNKSIRIKPLIIGGNQQNAMRAGTLNVPSIMGTAKATELIYKDYENLNKRLQDIKNFLIIELSNIHSFYDIININSLNDDTFTSNILSVSFKGIRSEVMLHALEDREIYVSAGSACSSHDKKTSSTLLSIGLDKITAESTIRISLGKYNNIDEAKEFVKVIKELLPILSITKK